MIELNVDDCFDVVDFEPSGSEDSIGEDSAHISDLVPPPIVDFDELQSELEIGKIEFF